MDLLKFNIFQGSFFKRIKFLFSSPAKAQDVFLISEAGTVGIEPLPMQTGFVSADEIKKAWVVEHDKKCAIWKNGVPTGRTLVLPISERTFRPLAPYQQLIAETETENKEGKKKSPLFNIARLRHAERRADYAKDRESQRTLAETLIICNAVLIGFMGILKLILAKTGGG